MNDERVRELLETLREHYGDGFKTALSTVQTEPALRRLLADVTGDPVEDVRDQTLHYGEEKSRNDFAEEDAGYVYGCMDPGDKMIVNALAELNLDATPARVETEDGEEKREKGRTFDGPDADKAAAVLASVRENHVAQAAGRYAREPSDPESRATVYVDTNAAPAGFVDLEVPGVEWLASDLQRTIVEELTERPTATARELADAAECTKEHVRETLARLEDRELVDREERAGPHGADVYRDAGADAAIVDLGETTNDPLLEPNRWSLAIHDRHAREGSVDPAGGSSSTPNDALAGGDDPPDPPS
jgi:DNA-binding HxlR family transcriptional regulator